MCVPSRAQHTCVICNRKIFETIFVVEKNIQRLTLCILCFYDYRAPKLWVWFVCAHCIFTMEEEPMRMDYADNFVCIPDGWMDWLMCVSLASGAPILTIVHLLSLRSLDLYLTNKHQPQYI